MSLKIFITGTDTEIGKTHISVGLLKKFSQLGYSTLGIKPVSSGGIKKNNLIYNEDALALQKSSSIFLDYNHINPFSFEPPIAPDIAARQAGIELSVDGVMQKLDYALNYPADIQIIEGVGGWFVPLNYSETMADFVLPAQLPVILVVGIRLGCISHALLTYHAIKSLNVSFIGWVANCINDITTNVEEIVHTLMPRLHIPFLGTVGHQENPEKNLDFEQIIFNKS